MKRVEKMKKQMLALFCVFAINNLAVADEIDSQLQAMLAEKNAIFKSKGSSKSYYAENCPKQLAYLQKFANLGKALAQVLLGGCYDHGNGVAKDEEQAVTWYRKAAEQGDAGAQSNLGLMYSKGLGVDEDQKQAVMWFRKAAEQGNAEGQVNLGYAYYHGLGVAEDESQAMMWYRKAAEQGNAVAQSNLKDIYAMRNRYNNNNGINNYNGQAEMDRNYAERENARTFQIQYNTVNRIMPR